MIDLVLSWAFFSERYSEGVVYNFFWTLLPSLRHARSLTVVCYFLVRAASIFLVRAASVFSDVDDILGAAMCTISLGCCGQYLTVTGEIACTLALAFG